MHTFTVSTARQILAETAEEAALLFYQELTKGPAPLSYSVADEVELTNRITLDQEKADKFAAMDHTADPGNW
ncbi:hypothetical protein LJR098_004123 [Rhizobium sp. LjRoot98]|uniref:hypothetical protein n=1 Tax=Rhizobium sp. LjRoot98 TaxID=3342345 RepID=UPI003ED0DEC2